LRGRTYGIIVAGALVTALPLVVFNRVMALQAAQLESHRRERITHQLCQALAGAAFVLATPPWADRSSPPAQRGELLQSLHLTAWFDGAAPPPDPPVAQAQHGAAPAGGKVHCAAATAMNGLAIQQDPADPALLQLSARTGREPAATGWLQLDSRALLGGEGSIRLLGPGEGTEPTASTTVPGRRLQLGDATLLLTLREGPEDVVRRMAQGATWTLSVLALALTTSLALQSEAKHRRQRQRLTSLQQDHQSGLASRLALEEDLGNPALATLAPELPSLLLAMVNLRLLQRQHTFLDDAEIGDLFHRVHQAVAAHAGIDERARIYRASEHRLALLLLTPPGDDGALLKALQESIQAAIQARGGTTLRPDDILITGQRLPFGGGGATHLALHGFSEILALEARDSVRLIEADDRRRVKQEAAIRERLQSLGPGDIHLVFQPILLLAHPGHFGLEVLIRFQPPELVDQPTGRLLATAHQLGIAHQIDALVLEQLPALQAALNQNPLIRERIAYMAVNISSDSVAGPERLDGLIANLQQLAIDCSRIYLEFTETPGGDVLRETANVAAATERLTKELNLRIFIDDFGSGLSNYRRICEAWYDSVKLDIDLVAGIGQSFRMQRYVGSLIETVHGLGKTVVCEGVEDFGDFATAVRLGADAVQGFLISRPIAWDGIEAFLRQADWASEASITPMVAKIRSTDQLLLPDAAAVAGPATVPLERQILDHWFEMGSFEEFVLLFVNELKRWGLDILRLSLAFLPDEDDIDCSQYVWLPAKPGEVTTLRMDRAFLQQKEHLASALHHIATRARFYRQRLATLREVEFTFLDQLKEQGCTDYLGIRLDSRGISIPVLTVGLRGESSFSDEQIQRIVSMSSLLSLLFYTFESERAKRLALLDSLTNLPNRRSFDSFLKANITAARINNTHLALALIDVDRFKQVNDTLGHAYGDACLKEVGAILNSDLRRDRDFVARLGGEEFAVILPDTSAEQARQLCEMLREAVTRARVPAADGREGMPLSISLGIAVWDPASGAACDGDLLQQIADDCLYAAKGQGRNRVVCRPIPATRSTPLRR